MGLGNPGELCQARRFGKPGDPKVRGVDPEQRRRAIRHRRVVVGRAGAVGRAHLDHAGAGKSHHVGHPERAADLHELAPRDNHLLALAESGQSEEHGGRVVVDGERRLAAE